LFADGAGFRAILGQNVVEQDQIGGDLLDLSALRIERALCRRD
jgi:hypothetical protein